MTDDERYGGFSLDELSDYLDSDRDPVRPDIEADAEAVATLGRLESLRAATHDLLETEAGAEAARAGDERWIAGVLAAIRTTAHAGRDIPVPENGTVGGSTESTLVVTEGALRGLVRRIGDTVPGVVVRRTRFIGDVTVPGASIGVEVTIVVLADAPVRPRAERLRTVVAAALGDHAPFVVREISVRVVDLIGADAAKQGSAR